MIKVYIYIEEVAHDPNSIAGETVPFVVNEKEIFFGPCKRRLRQKLKEDYLSKAEKLTVTSDEIYFIGLNGSNVQKERKIVWMGKVKRMMTFREAFTTLTSNQYKNLRNHDLSPLLVEPSGNDYRKYKNLHSDGGGQMYWHGDLTSRTKKGKNSDGRYISFNDFNSFNRDICFLLENIHAAGVTTVEGVELDKTILGIIKKHPKLKGRKLSPKNLKSESYYVFGEQSNGRANGLAGSYLEITDNDAKKIVDIIANKARTIPMKKMTIKEGKQVC